MSMSAAKFAILSPIELPEIRELIVGLLLKRDLVKCLYLNRAWNELFVPYIWDRIIFHPLSEGLTLNSLEKYSNIIREISITGMRSLPSRIPTCPNLQSLRISLVFLGQWSLYHIRDDLDALLSLNRSISSLTLENTTVDWSIISKHRNITNMKVLGCTTDPRSTASDFWEICSNQLESLIVDYIDIPGLLQMASENVDFFENMKLIAIERMVGLEGFVQLEIARRCTNLETLKLQLFSLNKSTVTVTDDFVRLIAADSWPKLRSLSYSGPKMSEKDVVSILQSLKQCRQWYLPTSTFGSQSFLALKEHFSTLVDLNVESYTGLSSEMTQEILCSCSRLQVFRGDEIDARVIVEGKPWVCLSLQSLTIFIMANSASAVTIPSSIGGFEHGDAVQGMGVKAKKAYNVQMLVFEQLSRLHKLSTLKIGNNATSRQAFRHGLSLRLHNGLDMLGRLTAMEQLHFHGTYQTMEIGDIEWMLSRWTRLRSLVGMFCYDKLTNYELRQRLIACNIKIDHS